MRLALLSALLLVVCLASGYTCVDDCKEDVEDRRGKMVPWEQGAWETNQYRNVLLEAGYSQEAIDAKLEKAFTISSRGRTGFTSKSATPWRMYPM